MEWLLPAGAAVIGYFVFTKKNDPNLYNDENGINWAFYQYKDGTWEATVFDEKAPPAYVTRFKGKDMNALIGMIEGYAMTHKKELGK